MTLTPPPPGPGSEGPPQPAPFQIEPPAPKKATIALVLSCIPLFVTNLVGILLGIFYVARTRAGAVRRGQAVAAIAVGSTVLGLISIAAFVGLAVWLEDKQIEVDPTAGTLRWPNELVIGDCLVEASGEDEIVNDRIRVIPCNQPHRGEVYLINDLPDSDFPGQERVYEMTEDLCVDNFDEATGEDYDTSPHYFSYFHPTSESWIYNDRRVICIVEPPRAIDESILIDEWVFEQNAELFERETELLEDYPPDEDVEELPEAPPFEEPALSSHRIGDCWTMRPFGEGSVYSNPEKVSCDQHHRIEFLGFGELPAGEFPGGDEVYDDVVARCRGLFEPYVGVPRDESILRIEHKIPTQETWSSDRRYACMIATENPRKGSAKGSRL